MTANDKPSSTPSADRPGRLFVVAGPSGVGKGTLIRRLIGRWPFYLSVSATTRPPRPGEIHGRDYIFLADEEFDRWLAEDRFLEWNQHFDHRYGTPRQAVEDQITAGRDVVLEIEVEGAGQVRRNDPDAIFIFIEPPSLETLERRLSARGDTSDVAARLSRARRELALAPDYDHRIVNDVLEDAAARLLSVFADPEGSQHDHPAD
ncbi:MAG: guanylate kinase [Acidimicrobiia bacterium]|nr:guanylate kinase [Acidimicrobiia bacterium]